MRGHLQCRDTLAGNEGCPLKTGTTVVVIGVVVYFQQQHKTKYIIMKHNTIQHNCKRQYEHMNQIYVGKVWREVSYVFIKSNLKTKITR